MTDRTRFFILVVTAPILAYTLVGGLLGREVELEGTYRHLRIFEDVVSLVSTNYVEEVEPVDVMKGALWGLAEGLDPESAYLTADEVETREAGDAAGDAGVGLVLTRQYYIQVVATRDGSPADEVGLQPGDFIRSIDGHPTRMMSTVRGHQLLQGTPGSSVTLTVIRGNAAEPTNLELTRSDGRTANVTSRLVADDVGYLRIAEFDATTAHAVTAATAGLTEQGAERLVVDLRGTATGNYDSGLQVAAVFTDAETLAIRETTSEQIPIERSGIDATIGAPVVLLTDFGTAGAAELFAAALTDADRAESVGLRTAGRAAEQTLVPLPDGGGLLLSSVRYLTASGDPIHRAGVEPAVVAQPPVAEFGTELGVPAEDPLLDRALEHLADIPAA
jgi:carboxyl-terminal processing protease